MNCGIVIVENRVSKWEIEKHILSMFHFLPKDWHYKIYADAPVKTLSDYNRLLTSKEFWESVPFDKVLITQMDAEILRHGIEEFIPYDYVGSPWKFQEHGGNGGLSLRSKAAMLKVIETTTYQGESVHGYEDVYFCNQLKSLGMNLAPREVCKKFACETIPEMGTLGVHAIRKYASEDEANKILNQYK